MFGLVLLLFLVADRFYFGGFRGSYAGLYFGGLLGVFTVN